MATDRDWLCTSGNCVRRIAFSHSREFEIDLKSGGNGASFAGDHWLAPEPTGTWTRAIQATLSFSVGAPRDLVITLSARPLISPSAPSQSLWVEANQCRVGSIEFDFADGNGPQTLTGPIPADCINADGTIVLHIDTDRVRTPREIGADKADSRRLGLEVDRLLIRESDLAGQR